MIDAYLKQTVTRRAAGALDQYNDPTAATDTTVAAKVVWKTRLLRNANGDMVLAAGHILTKTQFAHTDMVVVDGVAHAVLGVEELRVFNQRAGWKVHFQ